MERYATFIVRHRIAVVTVVLLITALFATQLRYLRFEIRRGAQLPQKHPYVQIQNRIAERFGGDTTIVIGLFPRSGDIFDSHFLQKLVRITERLENSPGIIPTNVFSLASDNVKSVRRTPDGIDVGPLIKSVPTDLRGLSKLRHEVLGEDIYQELLVGKDGRAAAIIGDFDDVTSDSDIYTEVESIVAQERDDTVYIALGGSPIVRMYASQYTGSIFYLLGIAVLAIAFVHYDAFGTVQAMVLPLVTAILSAVWALSIVGALRQPLDTWSAITPIVILAVAAGHAVQILKRYYEEYARLKDNSRAVVRALCAVGPAMLTAGVIAAAGFGSLTTFGVPSVRVFGLLLASGIVSALFIEMSFVPACRALLPGPRVIEVRIEGEQRYVRGALDWVWREAILRPRRVCAIGLGVFCVALIGAAQVRVDNSFRSWFPANSRLRVDDRMLNQRLAGATTLYVLLEGEEDGVIEEPGVLQAIADLQEWLERESNVGATLSVVDFVKRIKRVMDDGKGIGERAATNKRLIAQYLFLYSLSASDSLDSLIDRQRRSAVVRVYVRSDHAGYAQDLFGRLRNFADNRFSGLPVKAKIAGGALGVQVALNEVVVSEKIRNMVQVAVIIFLLSSFALRSAAAGLLVLCPLFVAGAVTFAIMGFTGTSLNMATASITAMGVSIGADFAIYLIFRIKEELWGVPGDIPRAVRSALQSSGRAVFFVVSAVVVGYFALVFSEFRLWVYLGALTAIMMAVSGAGALTIIPALIALLEPGFLRQQEKGGEGRNLWKAGGSSE